MHSFQTYNRYKSVYLIGLLFVLFLNACQTPDKDAGAVESYEINEVSNQLMDELESHALQKHDKRQKDSLKAANYRPEPFGDALIRECEKGSLSSVKNLIGATRPTKEKGVISWPISSPDLIRSLFADYKEYIFIIHYRIPVEGDSTAYYITEYKLFALAKGNQFLYKRLVQENSGSFGTVQALMLEEADSFEIQEFFKKYSAVFHVSVDIHDFFEDDVIYGAHCGVAGINPGEREQMEKAVEMKNTDFLDDWLGQPCLEKQAYAYEGFIQLIQNGYVLSPAELQVMQAVRQRKGTISTCSGCMHWTRTAEEIWEELDNNLNTSQVKKRAS